MLDTLTGADVEEHDALVEVTNSRGWRYIKNMLSSHRIYCIEQAHKCIKKHEDRKAGEWLAKSEEPHRIITLIQERKKALTTKREQ